MPTEIPCMWSELKLITDKYPQEKKSRTSTDQIFTQLNWLNFTRSIYV